ncbi:hypothetical protein MASR2M78_00740 [Treponema sp.]
MKNTRAALLGAVLLVFSIGPSSCAYFEASAPNAGLIVGIDYYPYPNALNYCVADAQSISDSLSGYQATRLFGINPLVIRKEMVFAALREAASLAPPKGYDSFVFYYAGHGMGYNGDLVMGDYTFSTSDTTLINPTELLNAIANIPAKSRLIILDSCLSGAFVEEPGLKWTDESTLPLLIQAAASEYEKSARGNILVMSASGPDQLSQESSSLGHGFFTAGLLESQREGDINGDGCITVSEAYTYARSYVARHFNANNPWQAYTPQISSTAMDLVLFKAK